MLWSQSQSDTINSMQGIIMRLIDKCFESGGNSLLSENR